MSYDNIPLKLREYQQWINWKYEWITNDKGVQSLTKIPLRSIDGYKASVINPLDWSDFDTARFATASHNVGLGFVFTKSDPFCGFDLDNPNGDLAILQTQERALKYLDSYSERSPSGLGVHVIVEAILPGKGTRRNKIECYDAQRFFTFTGDVYQNLPIANRQAETVEIYNSLKPTVEPVLQISASQAESLTDAQILEKAASAFNGDKFKRLWAGDWRTDYGNVSQSEADFALVNILSFYSRNEAQSIRLFKQSGLGQREKSKRSGYVGLMVKRSFDRMTPQITIDLKPDESWFSGASVEPWAPKLPLSLVMAEYVPQPYVPTSPMFFAPQGFEAAMTYTPLETIIDINDPGRPLDFVAPTPPMEIPGLVGKLVAQAWCGAPFQIAEVAIASALATMSLLSARSYRHGTLGLSLYLLVLARTSTGKSFGYKANDNWHNALLKTYKDIKPPHNVRGKASAEQLEEMIIGEIGSAQGLAQHMPKAPSTLFHADEYVDTIKEMARANSAPHVAQLKSELLRLMEMSGPGRVYRGRKYSQRSSGAPESVNVLMASLTILATGTPEAFYDDMSASLLTSGFLPRFTILEYEGGLTKRNDNIRRGLDPEMINELMAMFDKGFDIGMVLDGSDTGTIDVQPGNEAAHAKLIWFDNLCFREIEAANNLKLPTAGLWSRAKEHVRQISALIAIGVNRHVPIIEASYVDIAIAIVRPTLEKISAKVRNGETGLGDDRLEAEIKKFIERLQTGSWANKAGFPGIKAEYMDRGYFQLAGIKNHCIRLAPFRQHRLGANAAFEATINTMARYGIVTLTDVNGIKCCTANMEHFRTV